MYILDRSLINNSKLLLNKLNLYKYDIIIIIVLETLLHFAFAENVNIQHEFVSIATFQNTPNDNKITKMLQVDRSNSNI